MLNSISSTATLHKALQPTEMKPARTPSPEELEVKEKFQDFVAGTFYKRMLKALRSTQNKPAYLHGGQMEDIFQQQMDDVIAEDMAKHHGASFAEPLFDSYSHRLNTHA